AVGEPRGAREVGGVRARGSRGALDLAGLPGFERDLAAGGGERGLAGGAEEQRAPGLTAKQELRASVDPRDGAVAGEFERARLARGERLASFELEASSCVPRLHASFARGREQHLSLADAEARGRGAREDQVFRR